MTEPAPGSRGRVLWLLDNGDRNRLLAAFLDHLPPDAPEIQVAVLGEPGPLAGQLEVRGVPYHPLRVGDVRNLPVAAARLRRVLRHERPDVVHAHLFNSGLAIELGRRTVRQRPASLFTRHHNTSHHLAGHRAHARLDAWMARAADHAIAVSEAVRTTMVEVEGVPAGHVSVVHNGLAPEELVVDDAGRDRWRAELGPGTWAVAAGRLDPLKDYPTLVEAFARARARVPDLRLAIAGTGDEQVRRDALDVARRLGVEDDVRFLGWVDDVLALFLAADVFVQASLTEACPQTIMEAASLGVPIAATSAGGTAEIIGGWSPHVPPGDAGALGDRLVQIVLDPEAARSDASAAVASTRERFSAARMAAGYVGHYERLMAGRARTRSGSTVRRPPA